MSAGSAERVAIRPLVSWPKHAVEGHTYLLTVDVQLPKGEVWPYFQEEYEIGCHFTVGPACNVRVLRQSSVVLHRFGSTYGPAEFLLAAREPTADARLVLTLVNAWGIPFDRIPLEMSVSASPESTAGELETVAVSVPTSHAEAPQAVAPPSAALPSIFINYRREDTPADGLLLFDRLQRRYGAENVFIDVRTLRPGSTWFDSIRKDRASRGVFICLIGPRWLDSLRARATESTAQPPDYVRGELELALRGEGGLTVIPVLVDDTEFPRADALPRSIRSLAEMQGVWLRYTSYEEDVQSLIEQIDRSSGVPTRAAGHVEEPRRQPCHRRIALAGDRRGAGRRALPRCRAVSRR